MALERLQALALFWVPQDDPLVPPAAREKLAVKTPGDCIDTGMVFHGPVAGVIAATLSIVREHTRNGRLRLSPPESTPLPRPG